MTGKQSAKSHRVILHVPAVLLCALTLWLPLPFASVTPAGHAVLQIAAFVILALTALTSAHRSGWLAGAAPTAALVALSALAFAQAASWPAAVVEAISPEHARVQRQARVSTPALPREAERMALSLAPAETNAAALTMLALAATLLAAAALARDNRVRRALAFTLAAAALVELLYGGSQWMSDSNAIWGIVAPFDSSRLRGTFVNPDHLAVYLELVLATVFAWGWWAARRARRVKFHERAVIAAVAPILLWPALFAGLAFTGSRAGLVAALAGVAVQGLLLVTSSRRLKWGMPGLLATAAGFLVIAALGIQQGLGRWLATSRYDLTWNSRLKLYATSVRLWQRFPWTGIGLGSFREGFPLAATRAFTDQYWHAHSDYLEVLVTTGVVGAGILLIGLLAAGHRLFDVLRHGVHSEDRAAALAAFGALAALSVHSAFDFGLTLPANSATLAIIVGAALAAPTMDDNIHRAGRKDPPRAGPMDLSPGDD